MHAHHRARTHMALPHERRSELGRQKSAERGGAEYPQEYVARYK